MDSLEASILLRAAHVKIERGDLLHALVASGPDWTRLIGLAADHGVLPLLYRALEATCADSVPPQMLAQLRGLYFANTAANLKLASELCEILADFEHHNVSVLPFKGVTVADAVYRSLSLRPCGDLDLLIRKEDLDLAESALLARGFRPLPDPAGILPADVSEHQFVHDSARIGAELRWRITSFELSRELNLDYLAGYIKPRQLLQGRVPGLPPEEILLILCVHGSKHRWSRLMWISDVAELLHAYPELDWARLRKHAAHFGVSNAIGCGLLIARDALGSEIPAEALSIFCSSRLARIAARDARTHLFAESPSSPGRLYRFCVMDRPRDRIRLMRRLVAAHVRKLKPNESDRASIALPQTARLLYYALRPLRLFGRYAISPCLDAVRARRSQIARFLRLPSSERTFLLEAMVLLIGARIALWAFSLERAEKTLSRVAAISPAASTVEQITRAIKVASCHVPKATCLPQALAGHALFKRSGLPSTLRIGVATNAAGRLEAHAWLESDGRAVIGGFPGLARYSPLVPAQSQDRDSRRS